MSFPVTEAGGGGGPQLPLENVGGGLSQKMQASGGLGLSVGSLGKQEAEAQAPLLPWLLPSGASPRCILVQGWRGRQVGPSSAGHLLCVRLQVPSLFIFPVALAGRTVSPFHG